MKTYTKVDNSVVGRMTFESFVKFLDDHKMKKPKSEKSTTMFEEIEAIHDLYLDKQLENARCRRLTKSLSCLRRFSDQKSRLNKILDPTYEGSTKISIASVA